MSEHLEIERYLAGDRTADDERHLTECAECRDKVERMDTTLAQFRTSARVWGNREVCGGLAIRLQVPRDHRHMARWAALAAAVLLFASVPAYRTYTQRQAAQQAKADAALLDAVAADISRPAPEPLEPLIDLVSNQGESR